MPPARAHSSLGALRGVRAAVLATAALVLAAAAHLAGGGAVPSVPTLALLGVPLAWGAVALTGRPRGRLAILSALGVAQVALHGAFMVLAAPGCALSLAGSAAMPAMPTMPAMTGASMSGGLLACTGRGMASMAAVGPPSVMLAGHVLATVATALLLAHGERLLAALPQLLIAHLTRWATTAAVPALVGPVPLVRPAPARTPDEAVGGSVRRRGPPRTPGVPRPA
jgi:hypothetical protein